MQAVQMPPKDPGSFPYLVSDLLGIWKKSHFQLQVEGSGAWEVYNDMQLLEMQTSLL